MNWEIYNSNFPLNNYVKNVSLSKDSFILWVSESLQNGNGLVILKQFTNMHCIVHGVKSIGIISTVCACQNNQSEMEFKSALPQKLFPTDFFYAF